MGQQSSFERRRAMKGGKLIAQILKAEGVEYLFCFPNNPLIDCAAEADVRTILTRTERIAVNMADGYARASSGMKIGVAAVQNGPGIENAFAGVAHAYADSSPILLLPCADPRPQIGIFPNFQANRSYVEVTKWAEVLNFASRAPDMMRLAFTYLRLGQKGPVILEVPREVVTEESGSDTLTYKPVRGARSGADPGQVKEAVDVLLAARCPVIHAGQGVHYAQAYEELLALAEFLQMPVTTTMAGKSAFPENHPLSLGASAGTGTKAAAHFLKKADLILGIGCSFSRSPFATPLPEGPTLIQLTHHERDVNKAYAVDHVLLGDAQLVLRQVMAELRSRLGAEGREENQDLQQEIAGIKGEWLNEWMPRLTSDEVPINPYRVIWDLMHTLDRENSIVSHDSGNPRDQMVPFFESLVPHGYLGWGHTTQLGFSLGACMGAKLAMPGRTAVTVMGDAAFGMVGMDFETAARERIPILVVLLDNGCLGGYDKHIPVASAKYGSRFLSGDYAKIAEGLGGYAERVEGPGEIVPAIRRALAAMAQGQPALLDVITKEEPVFSRYW
jgi:acetolactate synthase-1/2/3 large subunit